MLRHEAELMYDGPIPAHMLDADPAPRTPQERLNDARETVLDWVAAAKLSRDVEARGAVPLVSLHESRCYLRAAIRDYRVEQRRAAMSRRAG